MGRRPDTPAEARLRRFVEKQSPNPRKPGYYDEPTTHYHRRAGFDEGVASVISAMLDQAELYLTALERYREDCE